MTKKQKQQIEVKRMWNRAIADGCCVRMDGGARFSPFATQAEALAAVERIRLAGMEADIVDPSLADQAYL